MEINVEQVMRYVQRCRMKTRSEVLPLLFGPKVDPTRKFVWVHQLPHMSRGFTQALQLQSSLCRNPLFQKISAQHVFEEADHPDKYHDWLAYYGFLKEIPFGGQPMTEQTKLLLAHCFNSALNDDDETQTIVLRMVAEGAALDFYEAAIPVVGAAGMLQKFAKYWKIHKAVDGDHLKLGADKISPNYPVGPLLRAASITSRLFYEAQKSWAAPLDQPEFLS